jgi:hypothetical protein
VDVGAGCAHVAAQLALPRLGCAGPRLRRSPPTWSADDEVAACGDDWRVTFGGLDERRVVLVCVVLYAAVASQTRPLTDAAAVAVAVPVGAVLVLAGTGGAAAADRSGIDPGVRRTAALWAAVVALAAAWELAAWLQQPAYNIASYEHPTASVLLDPVIQPWIPRFAAWCCWLYVGYRVVRP